MNKLGVVFAGAVMILAVPATVFFAMSDCGSDCSSGPPAAAQSGVYSAVSASMPTAASYATGSECVPSSCAPKKMECKVEESCVDKYECAESYDCGVDAGNAN